MSEGLRGGIWRGQLINLRKRDGIVVRRPAPGQWAAINTDPDFSLSGPRTEILAVTSLRVCVYRRYLLCCRDARGEICLKGGGCAFRSLFAEVQWWVDGLTIFFWLSLILTIGAVAARLTNTQLTNNSTLRTFIRIKVWNS